jgi:L-amino acid N-acyltransferase YncA
MSDATIRPATDADVPAILAIYADEVRTGTATFEYDPPDEAELRRRLRAVLDGGYPWLVAEVDGQVAGYAYASSFRPRAGYRFTVEDSVYVRRDQRGRGLGRRLLPALIEGCAARGFATMIAVVGDATNEGSIALHRACGFEVAGRFPRVGFKFGRWIDSVHLLRSRGPG